MKYNNGSTIELSSLNYDWTYKKKLDEDLKEFNPIKRDLQKEYNQYQNELKPIEIDEKLNFWSKLKRRIRLKKKS